MKQIIKNTAKVVMAMKHYGISADDMQILINEWDGNVDGMLKMLEQVYKTMNNLRRS